MAKSMKKSAILKKAINKSKTKALKDKMKMDGKEESGAHEKTETPAQEMAEPKAPMVGLFGRPVAPMAEKFGNLMKAVKK